MPSLCFYQPGGMEKEMGKRLSEWMKRGLCIALSGAMVLCSDVTGFAAGQQQETAQSTAAITEEYISADTEEISPSEGQTPSEQMTEGGEPSVKKTEEPAQLQASETAEETGSLKGDLVSSVVKIALNTADSYVITKVGDTVPLPGYKVTYADGTEAENSKDVKWVSDDTGIVSLDSNNQTAKAIKAGAAYLKLQSATDEKISVTYRIVVRPSVPGSAKVDEKTYQSVKFSWTKSSDADGYTIYRKAEDEIDYKLLARVNGNGTLSYLDNSRLVTGKNYVYRIFSYVTYQDEKGAAQYAESEDKAVVTATPVLGKAAAPSAQSGSADSVTLSWSAVSGASGYTIYRSQGSSTTYEEVGSVTGLSYTDGNLATGRIYNYKINAYRMVGNGKVYGTESDSVMVKPLPSATQLTASVKDSTSIQLSWNQVQGASGYRIYRKTGSGKFKNIKTITSAASVSYTDQTVKTGTQYTYRIRAYSTVDGQQVWGAYSPEVSIKATLGAPEVFVSGVGYNRVTLSWKQVKDAAGYRIYRSSSPNGSFQKIKSISKSTTLSYTNTGLEVGKTYYYKVRAYKNVSGKKVWGVYSPVISQQCIPAAPVVKAEAAGMTSVKLTWSTVELPLENSGYYIYQVTDSGEKKIKTCKNTATSYTVKNLTFGTQYTFKVAAYAKDANGNIITGEASKLLNATPKLAAVTIKSVEPSDGSGLTITWKYTKSKEEDAYLIYRSTSKQSGYKKIGTVQRDPNAKKGTFVDSKVVLGNKYYYKVICKKTLPDGRTVKSAYSPVVGATAAPGAPKLVVRAAGATSVKLSWNKVKGTTSTGYVNGYAIYRSTAKDGTFKKIATINSGTTITYTDTKLTTGATYYYKICAFSKVNNKPVYGAFSKVRSQKVVPGKPAVKITATDYTTLTLSWGAISECTGYRIYRSEQKDGTFKSLGDVSSSQTTYADKKVETGKTYYYKVRSYVTVNNKRIYGSYSDVVSAVPVLNKPTGLQAIMLEQNQVKLIWNAVPGAETYTILRSTAANGKYKIASEICTTNYFVDTNVVGGNTYYYKVFAVRGDYTSEMTDCVTAVSAVLEVNVDSVTVKVGSYAKVQATAKPAASVLWTSDDPSVALVTTDGTIYGVKVGTTTVKATANNITKSITVTVKEKLDGKGVEISKENGDVDFTAMKAAGYEYVMLRITNGTTQDTSFETNFTKAKAAGLKVGVTCYAAARTKDAAEKEASQVLTLLKGRALDYPIVYDMEEMTLLYGLTNTQRNDMIDAFKHIIIDAGKQYKFALCTSTEWLTNYLDASRLKDMDLWVSNYRSESLGHGYTGSGKVVMWRYTNQEIVNGVNGKAKVSISYYDK